MLKNFCTFTFLALFIILLYGCSQPQPGLSYDEARELALIAGVAPDDFKDVSAEAMNRERTEKYPAVSAVARTDSGLYGFICRPIGYNGPIDLALVIDGDSGMTLGMRILSHEETEHYVRDMDSDWFTGRFSGKNVSRLLRAVKLEEQGKNDIVSITGATMTTESIVYGVNSAFGLFREYVWQVDGHGALEEGCISISAGDSKLGEITLEDIMGLPSVKRTMSIHSSTGVTQHNFRGTLLVNVLLLLDPMLPEEYDRLRTVGADGYTSDISMDELLMENSVYLFYEDNGEPLLRQNGKPGAMRVVILDDMFGERFTAYLLELILNTT